MSFAKDANDTDKRKEMKCLKHLISFLFYLKLLSLCSTTCSPFVRTTLFCASKSSVIAIEKHYFYPLKALTLAPKKIAFAQHLFQLFPTLLWFLRNVSFNFEQYPPCHWQAKEVKAVCYFFLPKSAGTSPHCAVSHFLTSAWCGFALNQLSARAIMSNKGAVFSLRSSFVLHCIFFTQRMAL